MFSLLADMKTLLPLLCQCIRAELVMGWLGGGVGLDLSLLGFREREA